MSAETTEERDGWDPAVYAKFAAERAQAFWDLLGLVDAGVPGGFERCVDLGCGSGELTAQLAARLDAADVVGVDSSDAMLAAARSGVGDADDRLRFARGDIGTWTSRSDHDLVFANASLQWVPDHRAVLSRWWAALAPGGQLAVQVPANGDHPTHTVAGEVAATEPFLSAFGRQPPPDPVASNVLAPDRYAELLDDLGAAEQHVRLQVYPHRLESSSAAVDWVRGTSLTRLLRLLPEDLGQRFVDAYRERLLAVIGDRSPFFYPFKRILLWARKPAG